ncbi:hypothetical protein YA0788_23575, partial [Pseudomonas corrugata]|uniref:hypothetical protein n=1 Tax=Pseudomonas corrugata TaxID=47879 RepID=UPI0018E65A0E
MSALFCLLYCEQFMIPNIFANLETDSNYSTKHASSDIADIFSSVDLLAKNVDYLKACYVYLQTNPELSRSLYDELVNRHNQVCLGKTPTQFIPGCCCCGIDPYEPERQLSKDVNSIEAALLSSGSLSAQQTNFLKEVASYRATAHARNGTIGALREGKQRLAREMLNRFTNATEINLAEAEYLYAVLEKNECIGEDLIEYSFAGARLATLASRPAIEDSPVVALIRSIFRDGDGDGGGGGGG